MTNLKPCPFCGGEPKLMQAWVECKKCRAMAAVSGTRNEAISAWNRRFGSDIDVGGTEDGWISVDDRLPERNDHILTYTLSKNCYAEATEVSRGFMLGLKNSIVTHWMPLPQPPEGDTE